MKIRNRKLSVLRKKLSLLNVARSNWKKSISANFKTKISLFTKIFFLQEFEDNFDDEIDFTPPAEDTPSVQSPAEVFTLSVPNIALPTPSQFPSRTGEILVYNEKLKVGNFSVQSGV